MKLLALCLLVANAYAHFAILQPRARQVVVGRGITPDFGGPGDIFGNNANIPGGSGATKEAQDGHGLCGDDGRRRAFEFPKFTEIFGAQNAQPQATLVAGQPFEIIMKVTANHLGWLEVRYCDQAQDTQNCFSRKLLKLAPDNQQFKTGSNQVYTQNDFFDVRSPSDFKGLPNASFRFRNTKCQSGAPAGTCCDPNERCSDPDNNDDRWMFPRPGAGKADGGGELFSAHYIAPLVNCERCTLQFTWVTQNSPDAFPETFWNCADVKIVSDVNIPPPPEVTASPTLAVTKAPTQAPTNTPTTPPPGITQAPVTPPPVAIPGIPDNVNRDQTFNIQLVITGGSDAQKKAFEDAAARWQEIINKDTGNTLTFLKGETICDQVPFTENILIDDLLIFVNIKPLDGVGNVVSNSGGCVFDQNKRVRAGIIIFDDADADNLLNNDLFNMAALHEIGHVLGLGNEWDSKKLISPITEPGNPTYIGAFGGAGHGEIGGSGRAIIEDRTENGQIDRRHWEGVVYKGELMSPEQAPKKAISLLTLRALQDLGYGVDLSKADTFSIRGAPPAPPAAPLATPSPVTRAPTPPTLAPTRAPAGGGEDDRADGDRLTFLNQNAGSLNNGAIVSLTDPRVVPPGRTRTAEQGCAEAVDGFICADLARNVRCVGGKVALNVVNPFNQNANLKACVGGFCGGSPRGQPPGGNKCVGTAAQAIAGMRAGNEFFLPPNPPAGRLLDETGRELQDFGGMDPESITDDPDAWHTTWKGIALTNVQVEDKPDVSSNNAAAVAGGVIGALVVVAAVAMFVMNRQRSSSTAPSTGRQMTSQNPMYDNNNNAAYQYGGQGYGRNY